MQTGLLAFTHCALFGTDQRSWRQQQQQQQQRSSQLPEEDAVLCEDGRITFIGSTEQVLSKLESEGRLDEAKIIDGNDYLIKKQRQEQENDGDQKKNALATTKKASSASASSPPPLLCPGFIDGHVHLLDGGAMLTFVLDMSGVHSKDAFQKSLVAHCKKLFPDKNAEPGEWLLGSGWDHLHMGRFPSKEWIDEALATIDCADRPVCLYRCDFHSLLANSAALRLAGIDKDTPDVDGGVIDRDEDGNPTGIFRDRAMPLIREHVPKQSRARLSASLQAATKMFHEHGFTSCHDMSTMSTHTNIEEFQFLKEELTKGKLKLRMRTALRLHEIDDAKESILRLRSPAVDNNKEEEGENAADDETGGDDDVGNTIEKRKRQREEQMLKVRFLKMFTDGSLGSRTARMAQPYAPRSNECDSACAGCHCGVWVQHYDDLAQGVVAARSAGLTPALHAIGDAAVAAAIDALLLPTPPSGAATTEIICGRIEHCQHVLAKDLPRLAPQPQQQEQLEEAGGSKQNKKMKSYRHIVASVQPLHMASDAVVSERVLGQWRRHGAFPFATMLRQYKTPLVFGSDFPVVSPSAGKAIFAACTRRSHLDEARYHMPRIVPDHVPSATKTWEQRQCLTLREALHCYTAEAARSSGDGDLLGRLRVGFAADFVLLSPRVTQMLQAGDDLSPADPLWDRVFGEGAADHEDSTTVKRDSFVLKTFVDGEQVHSLS